METEQTSPATGRFAVVLNANARKVSREVEELVGEVVPPEDLYLSSTEEESREITEMIVERGYETVFAGGGDGTVMNFLDNVSRKPAEIRPAVGILKLGTGNAMARMVSSGHVLADLRTYADNTPRDHFPLALVESEGRRFSFAGMGLDAEILNDYRDLKKRSKNALMKRIFQNVAGYLMAFFLRTLPRGLSRAMRRKPLRMRVVNAGGTAHRLGPNGDVVEEIPAGAVLYDGPMISAMVGTVPYYGYGLKVMPFANQDRRRMHLRVAHIGMMKGVLHLRSIWRGTYRGADIDDFLVEHVCLEAEQDLPYQIGGDAEGWRRSVEFKIVPDAIRLLQLL